MGLGWKRSRAKNGGKLIGFGAVSETRGLGRKRLGVSNNGSESCCNEIKSPLKRQCSLESRVCSVEALPQELLIRVLCGVEHDDLKQLVLVSKSVMEAALVAKRMHFAYSTPTKVKAFRNPVEMEDFGEELEAPGAPRQFTKCRRRITLMAEEVLSDSVFQFDDENGDDEV